MNESTVVLQGWVGSEVTRREASGAPVASFRLACTPRYLKDGAWVNGATSWYTVNAWRGLALNVAESVQKGDPVVVTGRLRAETWERDGLPPGTSFVVDAQIVGHDLNRGVSAFSRPVRAAPTEARAAEQPVEQPIDHAASEADAA